MVYGNIDTVRAMTGITTDDISDDYMDLLMKEADSFINDYMGSIFWKWERFAEDYNDDRFFVMKEETSISSFDRVMVNGVELFECEKYNMLNNPTVSDGDSSNSTPDYWEKGSESSATLTWSTTYAKTGARSLSISKSAESTAYWNSEDIAILETRPYRVTGWIKTDSVVAGSGNGAYLRITWKKSDGTVISSTDGSYVTGTNNWTEYTVSGTSPVDASNAEVRLMHDGSGGTVYFDRFFFSKVNWLSDTTNYTLEMVEPQRSNDILIRYTRNYVPDIVRIIATKMYSRNALINSVGGSTQGMSYRFADQQVNMSSVVRHRYSLIERYDNEIKELMPKVDGRHDADWDDFGIVEI